MPKAKSKSASGDDSGPPTRQNSTDPVADESTGVSDDTSQGTNDTSSASLPVARTFPFFAVGYLAICALFSSFCIFIS